MDKNYIIETKNLTKQYGSQKSVADLNIHVQKGRIYGLLGRNGAGKTTLFNCISGEMDFDSGKIYIQDEENNESMDYEKIGYVYSTPILPEFLTGYEFIKFFTDINKKKIKNIKTPEEYADMVCLERSDLDKLIKGYSHGMKNKMQMLATIIASPDIILLDEPLTSLDVVAAHEMKEMLMDMKKDHIIIFSTHILQLAKDLCDEIVLLHGGKLSGVAEEVYHSTDFEEKLMEMLSSDADISDDVKENPVDTIMEIGRTVKQPDIQTTDTDYDPYDYD